MKIYIKKKGILTLCIKNIRVFDDTLYVEVRGFNSAIDKNLITAEDLREFCKIYDIDQFVITDYDYSPENRYVLTLIAKRGVHQYYIKQNDKILAKSYL